MRDELKLFGLCLLLLSVVSCSDDNIVTGQETKTIYEVPSGKKVYKPKEFLSQDWRVDTTDYSYARAAYTDNLAIFWESGFGKDLASPPSLEGHDMHVDLDNLKAKLEHFYKCYRDTLGFHKEEGSLADTYRMNVMIKYSLEGTAYGGTYDNKVGAFWAAPNRLQDKNLNTVAHELGHSFQLQLVADGYRAFDNSFGGFLEMTSQWMLWHVNPKWIDDEVYHWNAFKELTHKAFLHQENNYHSPFVLEYWSQKHGFEIISDIYKNVRQGEDAVNIYQRLKNLTQEQFVDEMYDCYARLVNFDDDRVRNVTRQYANSFPSAISYMNDKGNGWYQVNQEHCPENYGFNALKLSVPAAGETVKVDFEGMMGESGYTCQKPQSANYRFGFVGVTESGKSVYGDMVTADYDHRQSSASFTSPKDEKLKYLWLVVTAGPKDAHWTLVEQALAQWPYRVKFVGTKLI